MSDGRRALFVEDDKLDLRRAIDAANNFHFVIDCAECLSQAEDLALHNKPEIIFLDIGVPLRIGGGKVEFEEILDFIKRFRHSASILMLTGDLDPQKIEDCFDNGVSDYIDKSVMNDPIEFGRRIEEAFAHYKEGMKLQAAASLPSDQRDLMGMLFKILTNQLKMQALQRATIVQNRLGHKLAGKVSKRMKVVIALAGSFSGGAALYAIEFWHYFHEWFEK